MNYKDLFHIAFLLISSPARAWEEIRVVEDKRKVLMDFVYPMIGLCGVSVFIGSLWTMGWGAYLINELGMRFCGMAGDIYRAQQFAGYALVVVLLLKIILGILPDFWIIALPLQFYTLYVVWEGCMPVMQVREQYRLRFTIGASLALILCPWLIERAFTWLTVMLN